MGTIDVRASRSSSFQRSSSGLDTGGGAEDHLPIADTYAGFLMRAVFDFDPIDWSGVTEVVSAMLELTSTSQVHVARGSTPGATVRRATEQWSPNGAKNDGGGSWTTAPDTYPGPASSGENPTNITGRDGNGLTDSWDVTPLVTPWAPYGVTGPGGVDGKNAAQYGLVLLPRSGSSRVGEWYSARYGTAGQRPRLIITTKTGSPPPAPSLSAPIGASLEPAAAATFRFSFGAPITSWDLDVSTVSTFASTVWAPRGQAGSITGGTSVAAAYGGPALNRGTTYYWRARGTNATGTGSWSATGSFSIRPLAPPGAPTLQAPTGGGVSLTPTMRFTFPSAITSWDLDVSTVDTFASTVWAPRTQTGSITGGTSVGVPYGGTALAPGGIYFWRARGTNADGVGAWSATGTFTTATAPSTRDPYSEWASALLASMAAPRLMLKPGVVRPTDGDVAALVTADLGARVVIDLSESDRPMVADGILCGLEVEVDEGGWTLDPVLGVSGPVRTTP